MVLWGQNPFLNFTVLINRLQQQGVIHTGWLYWVRSSGQITCWRFDCSKFHFVLICIWCLPFFFYSLLCQTTVTYVSPCVIVSAVQFVVTLFSCFYIEYEYISLTSFIGLLKFILFILFLYFCEVNENPVFIASLPCRW